MHIWLLHTGGPMRGDSGAYTFGYSHLAEAFADRGHQVLGWAPIHNLAERTRREGFRGLLEINRYFSIRHVHAPVWAGRDGVMQLLSDRALGFGLRRRMARETPPDLIVAATPSLEWASAAVEYGQTYGVPVVVDICECWPDSLLHGWPKFARRAGEFALRQQRRKAETICREARALVGASQRCLDWGLSLAGRERSSLDAVVPNGYEAEPIQPERIQRKVGMLCERGVDLQQPVVLFAGRFDEPFDLTTVIESAGRLRDIGRKHLQFVFCGGGLTQKAIERRSHRLGLKNAHFLGNVDDATVAAAASVSAIGLCPYASGAADGLPRRLFEQMAGKLAVVSSLPGETARFLARHECGITYDAGSVNALANAINRLVLNPALLESLRANAFETWSNEYQDSILAAQLADHLASMTFVERRAA